MHDRDRETRDRLLQVAARRFATDGFSKVTVRDICKKARANVAAVNYHFGGKAGLYEAVLRMAIRIMQGTTEEALKAGEGLAPEEQLGAYVSVFLRRVSEGRNSWIHQLMMRELSDPTPALDLIIEEVIRPRMTYLRAIVASIIGCNPDEDRVGKCVLSVHSQCLALLSPRLGLAPRLGFGPATRERVEDLAQHIARFSIAGIRAVGNS
jgi:TetR/AcrR family transcriptional regulator, regulator of cefoperazone and chloramphenicol sensitivity